MALPSPLPDDPTKWDGWNRFQAANPYERLCLAFESRPTAEQIEDHTRQLLVWWQKKLPLKHQPSNPIAQLLRGGIDAAPRYIAEARSTLLNTERRAEIDAALSEERRQSTLAEFQKFLDFALTDKVLTKEAEANLFKLAHSLGLRGEDVTSTIHRSLISAGAIREPDTAPSALRPPGFPVSLTSSAISLAGAGAPGTVNRLVAPPRVLRYAEGGHTHAPPTLQNRIGAQMLLVPTGRFLMGSRTPEAPINEQPATHVTLRQFYISRHPITNAQYEQFDPVHAKWRIPKAGDTHPVVYVTHGDALKFCAWLSGVEGKRYRLPTEAEWEYAARGTDGRTDPWAPTKKISLTKFTLTRSENGSGGDSPAGANGGGGKFAPHFEEIRAETSPVGQYPLGASPFGVEDLMGNVWEWCQDFYGAYLGMERLNPPGPEEGTQRVCRGGSWKSRPVDLRTTTRGYNVPTYASNDVGFRIVCECD